MIPRDVVAGKMVSIAPVENAGALIVLMHGQLHPHTFKNTKYKYKTRYSFIKNASIIKICPLITELFLISSFP
jgi:hypothetical protein